MSVKSSKQKVATSQNTLRGAVTKFLSAKHIGAPKTLGAVEEDRSQYIRSTTSHLNKLRNCSSVLNGEDSVKEKKRLEKFSYLYHSWMFGKLIDTRHTYSSKGEIPFYILSPDNIFFTYWDIFQLVFVLYIFIVTPYRVALVYSPDGFLLVFDVIIDGLFLFDFVLHFFTAIRIEDGGEHDFIVDMSTIATKYAKGYLAVDLVSSIPVSLIEHYLLSDDDVLTRRIVRLMKLLKLARITRCINVFRSFLDHIRMIGHTFYVVVRLCMVTLAFAHINACLFSLIAIDTTQDDTWIDEWDPSLREDGSIRIYLASLYFTMCLLVSGEGGGIQSAPGNDLEMMVIMAMAVAFSMIYLYVVATLTALITSMDMRNHLYRENMDKVAIYLNSRSFPRSLHLRVLRYFEHFYGTQSTITNESELLSNLDTKLRRDVASVLSKNTFKSSHLFSDFHRDVHMRLLSLLRPLRIEKGERVFEAGSCGTEIFIVRHGHIRAVVPAAAKLKTKSKLFESQKAKLQRKFKAAIHNAMAFNKKIAPYQQNKDTNKDDDDDDVVSVLSYSGRLYEFREGSVFGEFAALNILPIRIFDAIAVRESELWTLRRSDLLGAFTGPDEYVLAHMTRIACRHLRWLKSRNSLVNKAIDIYSQVENSEQNSHDTIHMKEPQKMEEEP